MSRLPLSVMVRSCHACVVFVPRASRQCCALAVAFTDATAGLTYHVPARNYPYPEEVVQVYGICITSSGDIRYDNRGYAAIVQRKSRVRGQISAPSVPSCVCANELSFKTCVFQVVKSPQSRRDRCYCYRRHVRTL